MCREVTGSLSLCLGGRGDRSPQYIRFSEKKESAGDNECKDCLTRS